MVKDPPASAGEAGGTGPVPGWRRSPGIGDGNPLQDSCLKNPMHRGAWQAPWGRNRSDTAERPRTKHKGSAKSRSTREAVGLSRETGRGCEGAVAGNGKAQRGPETPEGKTTAGEEHQSSWREAHG